MIASEYGWTLDQIFDLTSAQMELFLKAAAKRRAQGLVVQARLMQVAVGSVLSKEGMEVFKELEQSILSPFEEDTVVEPGDLSQIGMIIKE